MGKKAIFLFLLIALPILVFLFLKTFGDNQYTIPVYYEEGLGDSLATPCLERKSEQYVVQSLDLPKGSIHIVQLESQEGPVLKTRLEELERVQDVFYDVPQIKLTTFINSASLNSQDIDDYNGRINFYASFWGVKSLAPEDWIALKTCVLAMKEIDNRVVLIDRMGRIRGYYNIFERDETDRLIAELRILKANLDKNE